MKLNKHIKEIGFYVLLLAVIIAIFGLYANNQTGQKEAVYSDLQKAVSEKRVKELTVTSDQLAVAILTDNTKMEVPVPPMEVFNEDLGAQIAEQVKAGTLTYKIKPPTTLPWFISILPTLAFLGVLVVFWVVMMNQQGGGGKAMQFGKSKAKVATEDSKKVTFADVAGADEEKAELEEIVEFLKAPKKFLDLGARIPRGVLLVGPPGTGKTLLAKAVAGEAGVPFFSISGSDFVEMYVGVGASRVRDLFDQAKKNSPSIVFIDEIDAVGRHRGAGLGGGHDEREQTLNQLLVEMDGFTDNQGTIIIAATNRPDILDPALLRPGRFDRQVVVSTPDVKGREAILAIHTRKKPLASDVDLSVIAKGTPGFTGADLENLSNEAALMSARRGKTQITMQEFEDAKIKVIMGPEKRARVITEKENRLTAYHEAGHAVVTRLLPDQDPIHQVSIIPRGRAGGYTLALPVEDKYYATRGQMIDEIVVLLGGRTAEKLTLDDISTGASNDLQRATKIAHDMVVKYGMSETLGPITFGSENDEVFVGRDYNHTRTYSEEVSSEIDREIKKIIDTAYAKCSQLLQDHMSKLESVAQALLEKETINGQEFEEIFVNS